MRLRSNADTLLLALFVRQPAGVEDGAELNVAGADKEIEMRSLVNHIKYYV